MAGGSEVLPPQAAGTWGGPGDGGLAPGAPSPPRSWVPDLGCEGPDGEEVGRSTPTDPPVLSCSQLEVEVKMLQCQTSASERGFPVSREEVSSLRYVSIVLPPLPHPGTLRPTPPLHRHSPASSTLRGSSRAQETALFRERAAHRAPRRVHQAAFSPCVRPAHDAACLPQGFSIPLDPVPTLNTSWCRAAGRPSSRSLDRESRPRRRCSGRPTPSSPRVPERAPLLQFVTGTWPLGRHPLVHGESRR